LHDILQSIVFDDCLSKKIKISIDWWAQSTLRSGIRMLSENVGASFHENVRFPIWIDM